MTVKLKSDFYVGPVIIFPICLHLDSQQRPVIYHIYASPHPIHASKMLVQLTNDKILYVSHVVQTMSYVATRLVCGEGGLKKPARKYQYMGKKVSLLEQGLRRCWFLVTGNLDQYH